MQIATTSFILRRVLEGGEVGEKAREEVAFYKEVDAIKELVARNTNDVAFFKIVAYSEASDDDEEEEQGTRA